MTETLVSASKYLTDDSQDIYNLGFDVKKIYKKIKNEEMKAKSKLTRKGLVPKRLSLKCSDDSPKMSTRARRLTKADRVCFNPNPFSPPPVVEDPFEKDTGKFLFCQK